jgi:hypothetical protein
MKNGFSLLMNPNFEYMSNEFQGRRSTKQEREKNRAKLFS